MNVRTRQPLLTEKIFPSKLAHSLRKFYTSQPWHLIIHKQNAVARLVLSNITALWDDDVWGIRQSGR